MGMLRVPLTPLHLHTQHRAIHLFSCGGTRPGSDILVVVNGVY